MLLLYIIADIICEDKTAVIGNSASIMCTLYNIMVENVSRPSILISRQSDVWFNTANVEPTTSSASEATFNVNTTIQLIVRKANIELKFLNGPLCSDAGDFTFRYNGATTVQDTSKITVQSMNALILFASLNSSDVAISFAKSC